jgi:glutathione S-transferase
VDLYSRDVSPFAARVRVSIRAKQLPIRILNNPEVASAEFGKINPLRRVPVLVLDDGRALPESETIIEYLEDIYTNVALRPPDPVDRARARLISRVAELYVFPAAVPIFSALAPSNGDTGPRDNLFGKLDLALQTLESFLDDSNKGWHCFGDSLTTADGALAPFLFYVTFLGRACGRAPLTAHHKLERFWEGAQSDPLLSAVINEISDALSAARRSSTAKA